MKQVFDVATQIFGALPAEQSSAEKANAPQPPVDVIQTLVRAVDRDASPSTVVSLAKETGLTIDIVAAALRDATATGLLAADSSSPDRVIYKITSLGVELL